MDEQEQQLGVDQHCHKSMIQQLFVLDTVDGQFVGGMPMRICQALRTARAEAAIAKAAEQLLLLRPIALDSLDNIQDVQADTGHETRRAYPARKWQPE